MLRAARSLPNLRQGSSRSFASQALFSERAAYGKLSVVQLKAELKTRGLTVSGKKSDLVNRLSEADEHGIRALATQPDGKRYASKKATSGKTQARPAFAPESAESVDKQGTGANIDLPEGPTKLGSETASLDSATPPMSPYVPATESTAQTGTTQTPVEDLSGGGTISTASLASTMGQGGPTSPAGAVEKGAAESETAIGQGLANHGIGNFHRRSQSHDQQAAAAVTTTAAQAASQAWSSLGQWEASTLKSLETQSGIQIQPFSQPITATQHRAEEYKWEERPLNAKERGGLWKLGGTVVGGWLLAALLSPKEKKQPKQK